MIERLQDGGFNVVAPPNPLRGPASDSTYIAEYLKTITGPIVLVAHSYGGFVITNAAMGNPNIKALVYIDGFMPDQGETIGAFAETWGSCVTESALNAVPSDGGRGSLPALGPQPPYKATPSASRTGSRRSKPRFCRGAAPRRRRPVHGALGEPAWKTIPSWALIGTRTR